MVSRDLRPCCQVTSSGCEAHVGGNRRVVRLMKKGPASTSIRSKPGFFRYLGILSFLARSFTIFAVEDLLVCEAQSGRSSDFRLSPLFHPKGLRGILYPPFPPPFMLRGSGSCGLRCRSQRRARDGLSPSSLFCGEPDCGPLCILFSVGVGGQHHCSAPRPGCQGDYTP